MRNETRTGAGLGRSRRRCHRKMLHVLLTHLLSSKLPITSGVPQGSVLGPLLFIIHYKDIPAATKATTALFADDTLLYRANCCGANRTPCSELSDSFDCELSVDLRDFECWAQSSNTTLNASKSAELVLGPRQPPTAAFLKW